MLVNANGQRIAEINYDGVSSFPKSRHLIYLLFQLKLSVGDYLKIIEH